MTSHPILTTTRKIAISDDDSYHWTVAPDGDGSLVEITYWEGRVNTAQITFAPDAARLVAHAMLALADELDREAKL